MDWEAIWLTLRLSGATMLILILMAIPLGHWLAFTRRRWKVIVEAIVALPLVLPPTVLGFYVLLALAPSSPIGKAYESLTGGMLVFTFKGLLVASVLYSLPFAVQPVAAGFSSIDHRLIEASWTLGASRLSTLVRVIIPMSLPSLITGAVLSFAHTLGEFGVVLMVGGNIPHHTRTISISIYDSVQALNYDLASRTSLALLLFSFAVLTVTYTLRRRVWGVWPVH